MKRAVYLSFLIVLLSMSLVFAQSDQAAVSSSNDETQVSAAAVKGQKVSEIRTVTIKADLAKYNKSPQQVRFDEKGGIIVPYASKGIKQTSLTPEQRKLLETVKKAKANASERKME